MTSIRTQSPPNLGNYPKTDIFRREDFNEALWENGYDVRLEEAVACPCKGTSADSKVTCSNCLGTGWVFVNPIKTRAFINSINRNTKYKEWSPELIGTVSVTFMNTNRFGFMDKIILEKNFGLMSEDLLARTTPGNNPQYEKFVFGSYGFIEIRSVFVFNGDDNPLIKLASSDYRIKSDNNYVLEIKSANLPIDFNGKFSVSYKHHVTYNIMDIPHDMRITKTYSAAGKREIQEMPVQAVARKAQYEMGKASNYAGNNVIDNSYELKPTVITIDNNIITIDSDKISIDQIKSI